MDETRGSLRTYTIGFVISIIITLVAYITVVNHVYASAGLSTGVIMLLLAALAAAQLYAQLTFFLHLGRGVGSRWRLLSFCFMTLMVFILSAGSLWIMHNLNRHMSGQDQGTYIIGDEGIKR